MLDAFLRGVSRWPSSDGELAGAADRALALLGGSLLGIVTVTPTPRSAVSFGTGSQVEYSQIEAGRDFVKRQIEQISSIAESNGERVRHVHLANGASAVLPVAVRNVAIVPIATELRAQPGIREARKRQLFGWVVAGSDRPMGPKEELTLVLISQRLAELAVTAHLESQLQEGSQFLSIASHELKTPLTAIYGVLQLQERMLRMAHAAGAAATPAVVDATSGKPAMQHSYLKMVIRQVERLNELIDGLLDVSRIQNGRFRVEPMDTDVATILQEVVRGRLSVIAQEAGVKIQIDSPQSLRARVDSVRMEEVITNLVMNAIRFSPEGGVVGVRLRDEDGAFRLMIRDQGPPIPPDDRERIFHPFERAQRTSRLGGLGLGLFISRQIAQLHGGNVTLVESVPGKGNLFEAYFPNRAPSQSVSA